MKLVVEISEDTFFDLKKKQNRTEVDNAVLQGTPLPKGHGRLIDEKDLSLMTVHLIDGIFVCDAPTIIEADKDCRECKTEYDCYECKKYEESEEKHE